MVLCVLQVPEFLIRDIFCVRSVTQLVALLFVCLFVQGRNGHIYTALFLVVLRKTMTDFKQGCESKVHSRL